MNQLTALYISVTILISKAYNLNKVSLIHRNQQEQEDNSQINYCQLNQIKIDEICQNCHFSCQQCYGIGQDKCISCNNVAKRTLWNNQCICMISYYENEQQSVCQECHKSCKSCQGSSANDCLSCYEAYEIVNGNCVCNLGYFYDYDNMECRQCHFSCEYCSGYGIDNCLKCLINSYRSQINNKCLCNDGYYEIEGDPVCKKCHTNCNTCSEYENCLSCSSDKLLLNNECVCQTNQFLFKSKFFSSCKSCNKRCLSCFGQLEYQCLSCGIHSTLQLNNSCLCDSGYYLINDQCQICDSNCLTCAYSNTHCQSCNTNYVLQTNNICCHISNIFVNNQCACTSTQYKDSSGICQQCALECLTCSGINCDECSNKLYYGLSCNSSSALPSNCNFFDISGNCAQCVNNYQLSSSKVCECNLPNYVIISGNNCINCSTFKSNCTNCNSSGCTQCDSSYYVSSGDCVSCGSNCQSCSSSSACNNCISGTFGSTCISCHQTCMNCSNVGASNCTQCKNNAHQDSSGMTFGCVCNSHYYMDVDSNCQSCDQTCDECSSINTHCTQCNSTYKRILSSNSCICDTINGFQDLGTLQCYNIDCGFGCANCVFVTPGFICNSCMGTETFRRNDPSSNCPCEDGYYDVQSRICLQCPYQCSTCQLDPFSNLPVCINCQINRDINDFCRCAKGFYESGTNCITCPSNCSNCINQDRCIQCQNNNFDHDKINGKCLCNLTNFSNKYNCTCLNGYYLNNINKKCLPCHSNCNTCIYSATNCIICNDYHAYPPNCECSPGFYLQDSQCLPCINNCFKCKSQSECLDCSNQMQLINNKCYCQNGYFNLPNSYECQPCSNQCSTCRYSINNCTSCKFNRILPQKCICPNGTYEIDVYTPCNDCDNKCKLCEISSNNCLQCSINRANPPTCDCIIGYFEDDQQTCQQCNKRCKSCQNTSEICIECKMNIATPPDCICPDGYYYESEQGCVQCHFRCKTCIGSNEYNCLSCDESKNFELLYNKCVCQKNYYFQNDVCIQCTIEIELCQTIQCGNGIIQKNEQCDDWNNDDRDGCSNNCKFEEGYFCESIPNTNLHISIKMTQCTKCVENCKICSKNKCQICQSGYFITPNFDCQKCDFHCKECSGAQQKDCLSCIKGIDYGLGKKCAFCEETQGLYTNKQKCVSKCGDGIKIYDEQCDDGNIINKDGCSEKCKIEEDWDCSKQINTISSCYKLNVPIASITFNRVKDFYQSQRQGSIKFNKIMTIPNSSIINAWKYSLLNQTTSYYTINLTALLDLDGYLESVQIDLKLLKSMSQIIFQVDFTTFIINDAIDQFPLKTTNLSVELTKYIQLGQDTLSTSKASKQFASSVLFILGGVSLLGLLMGSLEFYWNVLDNLQILSYITFINVNFPYLHNKFLEIFEFARFEFTNDYFKFDIVQNLDYQQNKDYPLIVEKQVEYNLVINLSSIVVLWVTPIILLILAKINLFIIHEILIKKFKMLSLYRLEKINSLTYLIYKLVYFIHYISLKYYSNFFYNIILRIYLSSLYDLNFSIFTSAYCWLWNQNPNLIDQISFIAAMFLLFIQIAILFILSSSLKVSTFQLKSKKFLSQFSSLYEGVNFNNQIIRQIQFLQPLRKIVFMGALILFYDQAIFQISLLISIQIISSIIQISQNPYLNYLQSIKGITQEVGLSLSLSLILIYYGQDKLNLLDQNIIEKLSYVHVGIYTLMLCISLIIDLYQQLKIIFIKYKLSRFCQKKNIQQEKQDNPFQQSIFIDLTQFQNQQKNQYSFTNFRIT
ncbi:unnamed protein product [Paramecium pentaurelia]|uniref:EGF-like domain-containing protein n=1 Tax=Paramecium pentaurelia TaxID=43138 RepID=A0A8S1SX22_9CILI|nr:unnamed protein product [Paramecium pentaurelia]